MGTVINIVDLNEFWESNPNLLGTSIPISASNRTCEFSINLSPHTNLSLGLLISLFSRILWSVLWKVRFEKNLLSVTLGTAVTFIDLNEFLESNPNLLVASIPMSESGRACESSINLSPHTNLYLGLLISLFSRILWSVLWKVRFEKNCVGCYVGDCGHYRRCERVLGLESKSRDHSYPHALIRSGLCVLNKSKTSYKPLSRSLDLPVFQNPMVGIVESAI